MFFSIESIVILIIKTAFCITKTYIQGWSIEKKINLPYLYLLLDPSVPFTTEETRYFDNEKRLEFFNKIKAKLDDYKASYTMIKGPWSTRNRTSKEIIKKLLNERANWLEIGN